MGKKLDPQWKAIIFTAYGNYLRHLYSFYEAGVKKMNAELLKKAKAEHNLDDTEGVNYLLCQEVRKLIRNRRLASESDLVEFRETILGLDEENVDTTFGNHLCQIRNYFSHTDPRRSSSVNLVSLSSFYSKYHDYAHLLFASICFSWNSPNGLVNPEIDSFASTILERKKL